MAFGATETSASELLSGVALIAVPHMDDEVLACGGTIAQLEDKRRLHLVYASDGARSPEPVLPWSDRVEVDLFSIRSAEARAALAHLGVPEANLHFLGLPDRRLREHRGELAERLLALTQQIRPDCILVPFRFDRHPDHLSVNHAVLERLERMSPAPRLLEYFVYHQWRLLPGGDVRAFLRPGLLRSVPIDRVSDRKRRALDLFQSQTTRYFAWQTRPNLTADLLDRASRGAEYFLPYDASLAGSRVFARSRAWIRIAHRLEPFLKRHKDRTLARGRRIGAVGPELFRPARGPEER